MAEFEIRVAGPYAEGLARSLVEQMHEEFGGEYALRRDEEPDDGEPRRVDPTTIAVISLVVSLPGAVLATVQLAERMKLAQKWKSLRAWASEHLQEGQQLKISGPNLSPRALVEAEAGEVIDAAIEAERSDT